MDRYRVELEGSAFEIEIRTGRMYVQGEPVEFSFEPTGEGSYSLLVDGRSVSAVVTADGSGRLRVWVEGREFPARVLDERALLLEQFGVAGAADVAQLEVRAPMPGLVLGVYVEPGQAVEAGMGLLVLEAMKMENELRAPVDGVIRAVHVSQGDAVGKNQLLIEFES